MTTLLDAQVSLNEVIDAMHEALEAVARKATKDDHPYTVARQVTQTVYARLASIAREAQLEREKDDAYENISTPPGTMPKQEPLKCAWCRRNPSIASFSRAGTASPICAECVWPASRGKPVLGNPPAWLDEPDDYVPQLTRPEAEKAMADLSGINSVVRGEPGACRDGGGAFCPPEETKPPARAHLKGCVLKSDHKEGCYVPFVRGETKVREESPGFVQGLQFDPPVSEAQANAAMDALKAAKSPALSPRQALGEALACLERAATLLQTPGMPDDGQRDGRTATGYTRDAISRARLIRKAAGWS